MDTNKKKCYICQRDFLDKNQVVKHIRAKHPDHIGNKLFKYYVKDVTPKSAEQVSTQNDLVSKIANTNKIQTIKTDKAKVTEPVKPKVNDKDEGEKSVVGDIKDAVESKPKNKNISNSDDANE